MMTGCRHRRLLLAAGILLGLLGPAGVLADNAQPVYLDLEETAEGVVQVVWKVPRTLDPMGGFGPVFSDSHRRATAIEIIRTPGAVIEKWTLVGPPGGLAGSIIRISGLEQTSVDALIRIRLADGTLLRSVLRPTSPELTVPAVEKGGEMGAGHSSSLFDAARRWRFVLLLGLAWLLSLTRAARRRGVVLCTVALLAGSLGGQTLGGFAASKGLLEDESPTPEQTRKILQGVLLNTYRAFILEDEELVYEVLARGVAGQYLQEVYLKHRESLGTGTDGEALSYVQRLDVKRIESMTKGDGRTLIVVADWDVYGSVLHWDHLHFRCNAYRAELTLVPEGSYWKLAGIQLLDEQRVI